MDEQNNGADIPHKSGSAGKFITLIIIIVLIIGIVWYLMGRGGSSTTTSPSTLPPATTSKAVATTTEYKDGTYTAEGDYQVHIGPEHIDVSLTLQNGIVTDATVTGDLGADSESVHYQNLFIGGFKQFVTGQNLDALNLGIVSGSSLTPNGFNNAVAKIKAEAAM